MRQQLKYIILLIIIISGCRGTSNLPEETYLYTGAEIDLQSEYKIPKKKELLQDLNPLLKPSPNDAILGIRPKLWIYNIFDTVKKDKGFKHWVKYKLGSPPELLKDVNRERVETSLKMSLENRGYYYASVSSEVKKEEKTAEVTYIGKVTRPYKFGEIHLPEGESKLARAIRSEKENLIIQTGDQYNLEDLQQQRLIIEEALKNKGFYYFNDSYLLFRLDSAAGDKRMAVFMEIKPKTPSKAERIYQIQDIIIHSSFVLGDTTASVDFDTVQYQDYTFVQKEEKFRPEVISRHIRFNENDIYTRNAEEITISRLIDLGVFKYVNINFEDIGNGKLRSHIRLSPTKKKSIQVELQAVTKSNSFAGPGIEVAFRNRNFLKGAELYELKLDASYETQIGSTTGENAALNSYELGINNSLKVPRFITPFNINQYSSRYVPQTNFNVGFRFMKRVNFYELNTFNVGYGFIWRETKTKTHNLFPVEISYTRLSNVSDFFDSLLVNNQFIRRSYENQFILGSTYRFFYNSRSKEESEQKTHNFYFNGNLDVSGNIMHLLQKAANKQESTDEQPYTIFNQQYSQFVRSDFDLRHYFRFNGYNKIASRIILGVGVPYGNSSVLPYTKQFSIGGSSSLRAFRPRSVGPGTFNSDPDVAFFDQSADIKIEMNAEYRFNIVGSFKGAAFIDAGNIWTIKEDVNRKGGKFDSGSFMGELAIGAGLGIRFDIDFFVIRLDLATPLKVPYNKPGERWIMAIGNKKVTAEDQNLSPVVFNIAIGYPF